MFSKSHYHTTHEPIFYCSRENEIPEFYGTRTNKTVCDHSSLDEMTREELTLMIGELTQPGSIQTFKREDPKGNIHPTQKPVIIKRSDTRPIGIDMA